MKYRFRRLYDLARGLLFHRSDRDFWMAEWIRGASHNDRRRIERATRRLGRDDDIVGGLLLPPPMAEVVRITRETA